MSPKHREVDQTNMCIPTLEDMKIAKIERLGGDFVVEVEVGAAIDVNMPRRIMDS